MTGTRTARVTAHFDATWEGRRVTQASAGVSYDGLTGRGLVGRSAL